MTNDSDTKATGDEVKPEQTEGSSSGPDTAASANNELPPAPKPNRAERRRMANQGKMIGKFIEKMQARQAKQKTKFKASVETVKFQLGKEEFHALEAICTIKQAEVKDDKGTVTQEANEFVNWKALFAEAKNLLVLKREQRMIKGERKRSSGRSSDRKKHKSTLKFIKTRGEEAIKNQEPYSEVKV